MQHLNLYSQLEQKEVLFCSARQQMWVVCVVVVLMLIVGMVMVVDNNTLNNKLQQLQQQQQIVSDAVQRLNGEIQRQRQDNTLAAQLKALEDAISFRRKLLVNIDPHSTQSENFSAHLTGLARQHFDGMWFTEIQLMNGGRQLALTGRTHKPEYVPRYLQKLAQEQAFKGHQFRVFKMHAVKEAAGILDFQLRARALELQQ